MKRVHGATLAILSVLLASRALPHLLAASPASGVLSATSPTATWSGTFTAANPAGCVTVGGIDPTCDRFALTIVPLPGDYIVTVRVIAANATDQTPPTDDIDLYIRDANGQTVAVSGTPGSVEELVLRNPPAGTYTVLVQPFVVLPGSTYRNVAEIATAPGEEVSNSYRGALYTEDFHGVPESRPAKGAGLVSNLKVSFNAIGRKAAEPTMAINANNTAFYAAGDFDFPSATAPQRLARTVVLRSKDKGATWQSVSEFRLTDTDTTVEAPANLDPMIYIDHAGGNLHPVTGRRVGRVFSVDLNAVCGANAVFSDDEGTTWQSRPLFGCDTPVNDHHTIVAARPNPPGAQGLGTVGYPSLLYFFFNRVADTSGNRSNDGGQTFVPAGTAFTGTDPSAGTVCGGLTGHLAADSQGRIFLPKGHCGLPWIARSEDGGTNWSRVRIAGHTPMEDHEVSLAVDTADNVYAVWQGSFRLPYLSVSKDHGQTWSAPIMMAPPGVREANFPTITAGSPGRIAVLFPGSRSQNFSDPARPWDLYVVVSVNALSADPRFIWTTANAADDPIHRGGCGPGRCDAEDGGSMFDFLDIQLSPADGAFWGTASDTCVGECVTNPQARKLRPGQGIAIRQIKGPSLLTNR